MPWRPRGLSGSTAGRAERNGGRRTGRFVCRLRRKILGDPRYRCGRRVSVCTQIDGASITQFGGHSATTLVRGTVLQGCLEGKAPAHAFRTAFQSSCPSGGCMRRARRSSLTRRSAARSPTGSTSNATRMRFGVQASAHSGTRLASRQASVLTYSSAESFVSYRICSCPSTARRSAIRAGHPLHRSQARSMARPVAIGGCRALRISLPARMLLGKGLPGRAPWKGSPPGKGIGRSRVPASHVVPEIRQSVHETIREKTCRPDRIKSGNYTSPRSRVTSTRSHSTVYS